MYSSAYLADWQLFSAKISAFHVPHWVQAELDFNLSTDAQVTYLAGWQPRQSETPF